MTRTRTLQSMIASLAVVPLAATPAFATTFTVVEGAGNDTTIGDRSTWFHGMRSSVGKARGFSMGVEIRDPASNTSASQLTLAFGNGSRIVAARGHVRIGAPLVRGIIGGTGTYFAARGTVTTSVRSTGKSTQYTHVVRWAGPKQGTPRTTMFIVVRNGTATALDRGRPDQVGNGRQLPGTAYSTAGVDVGTYLIDATVVNSFSGGLFQWLVGDATYTFADGTITASGPYQRATGSAPGALATSSRAVTGGTGQYSGARGQVTVVPGTNGTQTHIFRIIE